MRRERADKCTKVISVFYVLLVGLCGSIMWQEERGCVGKRLVSCKKSLARRRRAATAQPVRLLATGRFDRAAPQVLDAGNVGPGKCSPLQMLTQTSDVHGSRHEKHFPAWNPGRTRIKAATTQPLISFFLSHLELTDSHERPFEAYSLC
jgi:hypothetical protein